MSIDATEQLYPIYPQADLAPDEEAASSRRLRDLHLLHRVTAKVSSSLDLQEVLDSITQEVCDTLGYPACNILLPDAEGDALLVQASCGISTEYNSELNRRRMVPLHSPVGEELPAEFAYRYAQPYSVYDVTKNDSLAEIAGLLGRQNIGSILCAPLVHRDDTIGVLTAYDQHPRRHDQREIELLVSVGRQVAVAIENARLYHNSRTVAVVEERNRLAREIHDTLAQSLIALVLQLDAIDLLISNNPDAARRELQEARTMARSVLDQARRSVWALQPTPLLDRTLDEAIADDLDRLADESTIASRWSVTGAAPRLSPDVETEAYRVAQECISNIRRHSQARRVKASLHYDSDYLEMMFTDNGVGFDARELPRPSEEGRFGLISMNQRAVMMGGRLDVTSVPGQGTTVILRLPYMPPSSLQMQWPGVNPSAPAEDMIRVLLVDDHPLARQGIRRMMDGHPEMLVAGEAVDGEEALRLYEQLHPDVVLMDLQMPVMGGIDAMRAIRDLDPEARVIILTAFNHDEKLFEAIKDGARGFMLKDTAPEDLASAIITVFRGESLVQPNMAMKLVDRFGRMARHETSVEELTEREREVLRLIFAGMRNKQIANALSISEQTIKFHVANIFQKLGVSSRTEAVNVALERGWLSV
ncbi:MAG TPA: response regulator [Armatimonadota bacterium]|nr:response regulator [Armatimonadota bacterium]